MFKNAHLSSDRAGLSIYLNGKLLKMEAIGVLLRKKRTKTNMVTFGGAKVNYHKEKAKVMGQRV